MPSGYLLDHGILYFHDGTAQQVDLDGEVSLVLVVHDDAFETC